MEIPVKKIEKWLTRAFQKRSVLPIRPDEILKPIDSGIQPERDGARSIPKIIHIVWVGDESKCPLEAIETWRTHNPDFTVRLWGNRELQDSRWHNGLPLRELWDRRCFCGIADLMRYEILYWYGGFAVDADSLCRRPLAPWLFHCEAFACWENEIEKPGLIANGYLASVPRNEFLRTIILSIAEDPEVARSVPGNLWERTGPGRLTRVYQAAKYSRLVIYPSHFFMPRHHSGRSYDGDMANVFAEQLWASTANWYKRIGQTTATTHREKKLI
jgi:mannosyltransferase OCH1-like enzyme